MNVVKHTKYIWELEDFIPHNEIDYLLDMFDFHNPKLHADFRTKKRNNDTYIISDYPDLDAMAWKLENQVDMPDTKKNFIVSTIDMVMKDVKNLEKTLKKNLKP